jgi:predicted aspartyl protease
MRAMRSRTLVIALALSLLGLPIGAAREGEPTGGLAPLVEAHLRWLGGREALAQLQDLIWTGTFDTAGFNGRTALRETRDGWMRVEMEGGPFSRVEVVGAAGSWIVTLSGQVETMSAHETELRRRGTLRDFAIPLLDLGAAGLSDLGSESRDGKSWRVVRIGYPDGDSYDLFLNPADGSCTWARVTEGPKKHWVRFTDWRKVARVRLPFEQRESYPDAKEDSTLRWSSVAVNQGLAATSFERPQPQGEVVHFADGAASTGWLPLDLFDGAHMIVRGTVAGQASDILIDSGAQMTMLSKSLAKKLQLKTSGRVRLEGVYGAQEASLAPGVNVQIGKLYLSSLTVLVTSLPRSFGKEWNLTVGSELFNGAVVEIDYPGKRIAFHDPARYQPEPDAVRVPLQSGDGGDMLVEASVEGLPPALFSIDTGGFETVSLYKSYVEKNGLLEQRSKLGHRSSSGFGGSSKSTIATLKSFSLGGFEWHDMRAMFEDAEEGGFSERHVAGNLGAGYLKHFRVVLDRTNAVMYLTLAAAGSSSSANGPGLDVRSRVAYASSGIMRVEGFEPGDIPDSTNSRKTGVHLGVQNTRRSRYSSESSENKTAAGPKHVDLPPFPLFF